MGWWRKVHYISIHFIITMGPLRSENLCAPKQGSRFPHFKYVLIIFIPSWFFRFFYLICSGISWSYGCMFTYSLLHYGTLRALWIPEPNKNTITHYYRAPAGQPFSSPSHSPVIIPLSRSKLFHRRRLIKLVWKVGRQFENRRQANPAPHSVRKILPKILGSLSLYYIYPWIFPLLSANPLSLTLIETQLLRRRV